MDNVERDFLDRLIFKRQDAKITQLQMAMALGISPTWLSYLETGKRPWRYEWYVRYCDHLSVLPQPREACPISFCTPRGRGRQPRYDEPLDRPALIGLTADQKTKLKTMAQQAGVSGPELVRQLIDFAWNESNGVNTAATTGDDVNSVAPPHA